MMQGATLKSPCSAWPGPWRGLPTVLALAGALMAGAQEPVSPAETALNAYQTARQAAAGAPDDPTAAWHLARACFDWAEFSTNDAQRAELATEGIAASERAIRAAPNEAGPHYYLGMNLGQLARTRSLGALKLVHRMEKEFFAARDLDPAFDHAGPDRNLGLLYLEAPGWPVSVGNRFKARKHLQQAAELAPHFPENRLNLMEAFARWKDTTGLREQFELWKDNLKAAREHFSGDRWAADWIAWEQRLAALKALLPEPDRAQHASQHEG